MPPDGDFTQLLVKARSGGSQSQEELIQVVYGELRRLAGSYMSRERPEHTLQPTALVNEAYLRLIHQNVSWESRAHFMGIAAQQMRRILVDHARQRRTEKRQGQSNALSLDEALLTAKERPEEIVELEDSLNSLAEDYPRQAHVVDLRFFGGYSESEVAQALNVSIETVKRDWSFAKAWLRTRISNGNS